MARDSLVDDTGVPMAGDALWAAARMRLSHDGARSHKPEIEALGYLASEAQVLDGLRRIVGAYGNVISISSLSPKMQGAADKQMFLVKFERTEDALAASRNLKCYLFGFSMIAVFVPRNGKGLE